MKLRLVPTLLQPCYSEACHVGNETVVEQGL